MTQLPEHVRQLVAEIETEIGEGQAVADLEGGRSDRYDGSNRTRPIVGGPGTLVGPLLGSVVLTPLSELTRWLIRGRPGVDVMIYGAILVLVITFLPRGLVGALRAHGRGRPD